MSSTVNPGMAMDELVARLVAVENKLKSVLGDESDGTKSLSEVVMGNVEDRLAVLEHGIDGDEESRNRSIDKIVERVAEAEADLKTISSAHNSLRTYAHDKDAALEKSIESLKKEGTKVTKGAKTVSWKTVKVKRGKVKPLEDKITKYKPSDGWICTGFYYIWVGSKFVHLVRAQCLPLSDNSGFKVTVKLALNDAIISGVTIVKVSVRARFVKLKQLSGAMADEVVDVEEYGDQLLDIDDDNEVD